MFWLLVSGVLVVLLCYLKYFVYNYWANRGIPSLPARNPFGCLGPVIQGQWCLGQQIRNIYESKKKQPYLGLYFTFRPVLMVNDAALVKRVLITDFDHFMDRGVYYNEEKDPVSANLFSMQGQKWRELRAKLSPTFTSGKLKNMFPTIEDKSNLLKEFLFQRTSSDDHVQLKQALIRLNLSIIASTFFGFELNAFENPDHEFNKMGDLFFDQSTLRNKFANFGFAMCPSVLKWLNMKMISPVVSEYILNLVNSVVKAREADPSLVRKDFIQTIMELMKETNENEKVKLTIESCAAQAFLFYTAGYEASATTTSHCIYELSKSPQWMAKVREEVDDLLKKRNGRVLYEDVVGADMKVLEACMKETMRKYPAVPFLNRECTKKGGYRVPETDHVIPEGTPIILPLWGLHMDPEFYPDPEKYDPSRFEGGNYNEDLPFYPVSGSVGLKFMDKSFNRYSPLFQLGAGPRFCVGARMGYMMIRMALITLIHNFEFEAIDDKLDFTNATFVLADANHVRMRITKRNRN